MSIKYKDYYDVLGVPRDADEDAIRRAYRKLARQNHPDVNKEAHAKERFQEISDQSPAEEAGLKTGDMIVEINGKKVGKAGAFRNRIATTPPSTPIQLKIFRNGEAKPIDVITKPLDGTGTAASSRLLEKIGLSVEDLDSEMGRRMNLDDERGVLIADVEQNSPAWRVGLEPGQIIRSINRHTVENVAEFMQPLSENTGESILLLISDGRGSRFVIMPLD